MKVVKSIVAPLWKVWFILWFSIPFILMYPLFYFALSTRRFDMVFRLKRVWSTIICAGTFLYPKIRYKSRKYNLPRPCIVVSNHTSYLDICFSPFYIDHTAIYMGKRELLKAPLFRIFFIYMDIPVNRGSIRNSHQAFEEAGRKIDQGFSQVIYPEGTISPNGMLKPFKNGAFKLAIEKQVPIVPVANLNNWKYLQNGGFLKSNGRPGRPTVIVGDPIETRGLSEKNVNELKEKVFGFIISELQSLYGGHN